MKKLLPILLLFAALSAPGQTRISATLTVTNVPWTNGIPTNTLVFNTVANTRTWSNSSTSSRILTNATVGGSASNLYNNVSAFTYAGQLGVVMPATNQVTLYFSPGSNASFTLSGNWGTVAYTTNTLTNMTLVRVPIGSEIAASNRAYIASNLVDGITSFALNKFGTNVMPDAVMNGLGGSSQFVGRSNGTGTNVTFNGAIITNAQAIVFSNTAAALGTITNLSAALALLNAGNLTNATNIAISPVLRALTNDSRTAFLLAGNLTNMTNIGLSPVLWALSNNAVASALLNSNGSVLTNLGSNAVIRAGMSNAIFSNLITGVGTDLATLSTNAVQMAWTNVVSQNNVTKAIARTNLGLAGESYALDSNTVDFAVAPKFHRSHTNNTAYLVANTGARDAVMFLVSNNAAVITFTGVVFPADQVIPTNGQTIISLARFGTNVFGAVSTNYPASGF